ncbi:MAG: carboxypeptidase-like regulatory domain-containing protein [Pedobacter sp.]|nr:MAG: carboxypeptidase-like regulatory domain-containing protein [Pedobacter sp.]
MKKYLLFLVLLSTSVCYAQKSIKGQVIDEKTKEVLPGVSVYINNSTVGTITDVDGKFELIVPFTGKMELVASHVIYKKKNILIESGNYEQLLIALEAQDNTLKEVIIKAKRNKDDNFKKWGDLFTKIIMGNNPRFANNCKITNVKELVFYFDKDINELSVYAKSPLIIENELLNYSIKIDLENFNYNFGNDVLRLNYSTFFEDLSNKENLLRVKALRDEAYFGSQMHFMRSIYNNSLTMDGFSIYHYRSIKNAEKERVNKVVQNKIGDRFAVKNNPNFDLKALFPTMDTVNYYKMVLKQDDVLALDTSRTQSRRLAILNRQLGTVKFEFSDTLMVKYQPALDQRSPKIKATDHRPSQAVQYSFMYPIEKGGINLERNGYYPELILFIYGNMSERRISQLLPWDYDPDKN